MTRNLRDGCLQLLISLSLLLNLGHAEAQTPQGQMATGKPPYNIVFIIVDQRTNRVLAGPDYSLPGIDAIASHGVRFENHFIATAMCTPSRATFLTGRPPQYHHVIDQMTWFPSWTGQGTEPASRWRVDGDEGVSAVDGEAEGGTPLSADPG